MPLALQARPLQLLMAGASTRTQCARRRYARTRSRTGRAIAEQPNEHKVDCHLDNTCDERALCTCVWANGRCTQFREAQLFCDWHAFA